MIGFYNYVAATPVPHAAVTDTNEGTPVYFHYKIIFTNRQYCIVLDVCVDKYVTCPEFAKNHYCTDYKKLMKVQCRKSCNFCGRLLVCVAFLELVDVFWLSLFITDGDEEDDDFDDEDDSNDSDDDEVKSDDKDRAFDKNGKSEDDDDNDGETSDKGKLFFRFMLI